MTAGDDNPNGARLRVLLTGVPAAAFARAGYERVALLFDGRDEEAVAEARREWSQVKAAGVAPSYWREGRRGMGARPEGKQIAQRENCVSAARRSPSGA